MVHLIVLVHGLWGNPSQFDYISAQLSLKLNAAIDEGSTIKDVSKNFIVYRTSCNQGYFTYDGIDVCGARAAKEIENEVLKLNQLNMTVDKLSVVGYSLGGLISRFAIGLLYKRGFFEQMNIELVNYTSFCSPHVGVVVLGRRWVAQSFNFIGQYAMSTTSKQLFIADNFERSKRPLLSVMADPKFPYFKALAAFKHRSLYANIVNDHRCEWYTAGIDSVDPFTPSRVPLIQGPYIDRYSPVILDTTKPLEFEDDCSSDDAQKPLLSNHPVGRSYNLFGFLANKIRGLFSHCYNYTTAFLKTVIIVPIWFCAFMLNAGFQSIFSANRRRSVKKGISFDDALEGTADNIVDSVFTAVQHAQEDEENNTDKSVESVYSAGHGQKVDLGPHQKFIVNNLNSLTWKKYPVHIHKATHAHAAVIVRYPSTKFTEGYAIVDHFVDSLLR